MLFLCMLELKSPCATRTFRSIRNTERAQFECSLRNSPLFSSAQPTVDCYADQLKWVLVATLYRCRRRNQSHAGCHHHLSTASTNGLISSVNYYGQALTMCFDVSYVFRQILLTIDPLPPTGLPIGHRPAFTISVGLLSGFLFYFYYHIFVYPCVGLNWQLVSFWSHVNKTSLTWFDLIIVYLAAVAYLSYPHMCLFHTEAIQHRSASFMSNPGWGIVTYGTKWWLIIAVAVSHCFITKWFHVLPVTTTVL